MAHVTDIATSENPNAVCAICRKNGRLAPAAAISSPFQFIEFFVCAFHAARARRWQEIAAISARYRTRQRGELA